MSGQARAVESEQAKDGRPQSSPDNVVGQLPEIHGPSVATVRGTTQPENGQNGSASLRTTAMQPDRGQVDRLPALSIGGHIETWQERDVRLGVQGFKRFDGNSQEYYWRNDQGQLLLDKQKQPIPAYHKYETSTDQYGRTIQQLVWAPMNDSGLKTTTPPQIKRNDAITTSPQEPALRIPSTSDKGTDTNQKEKAKPVDDYKPTDKELDAALNSKNPAEALAKIADRLAVISLADGKEQAKNSIRGLNNPEFRKALQKYIDQERLKGQSKLDAKGQMDWAGIEAIRKLATAIGPNKGYFVQERITTADWKLGIEFSKANSPVIENGRQVRSGEAIAADLKLIDARDRQGTELAAKCKKAAEKTGPGTGLNDPALKKEIEEFVSKNYLAQTFPDFALKQQFVDKMIDPNYRADLDMNKQRAKISFSGVGQDGALSHIADITVRPFPSQTETATKLAGEFNNAGDNQGKMDTAMDHLQVAFEAQIKEAKNAREAEHRLAALVDIINEIHLTGRLELPPDLKLPPDFKVNNAVEVEVIHVPIRRRQMKLNR